MFSFLITHLPSCFAGGKTEAFSDEQPSKDTVKEDGRDNIQNQARLNLSSLTVTSRSSSLGLSLSLSGAVCVA